MNGKIRSALGEIQCHWPALASGPRHDAAAPQHLEEVVEEYCGRPVNRDGRGVKASVVAEVCRTLRHIKSASIRTSAHAPAEMRTTARKLLKTLYHVGDFTEIASLAVRFAGELQKFGKRSARRRPVCPAKSVLLGTAEPYGEVFLARVVSVKELMSVGAKLHQCVAHADSAGRKYHQLLRRNAAEFWHLHADQSLALLQVDRSGGEKGMIVESATRDDHVPNLPSVVLRRVLVELNASGDEECLFQEAGAFWHLRHSPEPTAAIDIGSTKYRVWHRPDEIVFCTNAGGKSTWSHFRRRPANGGHRRSLRRRAGRAGHGTQSRWVQWCWSPDAMDVQHLLDILLQSRQLYEALAFQDKHAYSLSPEPTAKSGHCGSTDAVEPETRTREPAETGEFDLAKGTTVDYEVKDGWWVGQIREQPEVISQGRSREELIEMILDAKELCASA